MLPANFICRPLCLLWFFLLPLPASLSAAADAGQVHTQSRYTVAATTERAKRLIEAAQYRVFGVIDHAAEASKAGARLPETRLLVFGYPPLESLLLLKRQDVGLELPLKLLIWEDAKQVVWISYRKPAIALKAYQLKGVDALLEQIDQVYGDISRAAAR